MPQPTRGSSNVRGHITSRDAASSPSSTLSDTPSPSSQPPDHLPQQARPASPAGVASACPAEDHSRISPSVSPLGGGCLLAGGRGLLTGSGLGGRRPLAGVVERGGGLGGGGLGGVLGGAGGLQRLGERVCPGGGLGGPGGGGLGGPARALVFGMTTGLGLFSAPGIVRRRGQEAGDQGGEQGRAGRQLDVAAVVDVQRRVRDARG